MTMPPDSAELDREGLAVLVGSGCSVHAKIPMFGEIRDSGKATLEEEAKWDDATLPELIDGKGTTWVATPTYDSRRKVWDYWRRPGLEELNIEELHLMAELDRLRSGQSTSPPSVDDFQNFLSDAFSTAIKRSTGAPVYTDFIEQMHENHRFGHHDADSLTSFNWDGLATNAVYQHAQLVPVLEETDPEHREGAGLDVVLPHGSLRWGKCPECEGVCLYLVEDEVVADATLNGTPLPSRCHPERELTHLPPSLLPRKITSESPKVIMDQWQRFRKGLETAGHILMVGYSGASDPQVKTTLKQCTSRPGPRKRVTIVDPNANEDWFREHLTDVFPALTLDHNVHPIPWRFKKWVDDGCPLSRHEGAAGA